jgi:uncharacterized protein (TIGR02646 family)
MIKLTPATIDAALLLKLHVKTPEKQRSMWDYTRGYARTFKDEITTQMATIQNRRCAYCGSKLSGDELTRDHIAPKEHYPQFTFFPANLVLACTFCNTECKKATDTVTVRDAVYENCTFLIIHPQLDEPTDHITFVGGVDKILIKVLNGSPKGRETVRIFRLASPDRTKRRAEDAATAKEEQDIAHMPGRWRDSFIWVQKAKLGIKFRVE